MKLSRTLAMPLFGLSVLVTVGGLSSCSINPATGTPDLVLMSESEEIKIGKEMHEKILKSTPIYDDEKVQAYVNKIGQKVAASSDRPDLTYHFTVIDSPDINAFALPGGYIYINRGLLIYLNTEAQLAAVLAHEVAHVTARHGVRQKTAQTGAGVLSVLSVLTTGSTTVGDVASLWSSAAVMGYGREMELEADSFGAQYLYNSGYQPQAMAEVIGVLKDQESFARRRAKDAGKKAQSYHGVFSSHPRNDQRLQEVIAKAGTLPDDQTQDNGASYRENMEGLVYGNNVRMAANDPDKGRNRYTHSRLGFTLVFPQEWQVENQRSAIVAAPAEKNAQLALKVTKNKDKLAPDEFIRKQLGVGLLTRSEPIAQYGLRGHMGIIPPSPGNKHPKRLAVLFQGSRAYILEGSVSLSKEDTDYDEMFVSSIRSFRPARGKERKPPKSKVIHFVKANERTRFALLAKQMRLGSYGEEQLRLINGYYPRGEPEKGEWIKIVQYK